MTSNNLCSSCTNIGCEFQSGIVRTKCAFYMPPHMESDNCGNYVVMQPTAESEDMEQAPKTDVLDKIRAEIIKMQTYKLFEDAEKLVALDEVLQIIDKYRGNKE